jgi:hypothetical protein
LREILALTEAGRAGGLQVLPGDAWKLHYPADGARRSQILSALLAGEANPADVHTELRPDALLYDTADIDRLGVEPVQGRIRDLSETTAHYDYERFARFIFEMRGKEASLESLQAIYDTIAQSRIRTKLMQAYGATGQRQMEAALRVEAGRIAESFGSLQNLERALAALRLRWLARRGLTTAAQTSSVEQSMTEHEKRLIDALSEAFNAYAEQGSQGAYETFVHAVRDALPDVRKVEEEMSPSMEKLKKELEPYEERVPKPGPPEGLASPPDAQDLHNQIKDLDQGESVEGIPAQPVFEITPSGTSQLPMCGRYLTAHKSRFVPTERTWSNETQLREEYITSIQGEERQTIRGTINPGLKSLPIPRTYALDMQSLKYTGARPRFFRDQNGCFYVVADGRSDFSVDFLKEPKAAAHQPTAEDLAPIHTGALSAKTEAFLKSLSGDARSKALRIQQFLRSQHWYPGGGDHGAANALKLKIKTESSANQYVPAIDQSEYLDCDLSNTLGVHLLRRAGIPAALGVGHHIESARQGKAVIDANTAHAWTEFWDGAKWVPIDFTPPPKPEDEKKKDKEQDDASPGQEADDGGIESPPPDPGDVADQAGKRVKKQLKAVTDEQKTGEAKEGEVAKGTKKLEEARETLERMSERQREIEGRIEGANSFGELEALEQEAKKEDLLDVMHEETQQKIDAKKKLMKEELKDEWRQMEDDGFLDKEKRQELERELEEKKGRELDRLEKEAAKEQKLYAEYAAIKAEVAPLVERWFRFFADNLPKKEDLDTDEDSLSRRGTFNRRAVMKPRNLLFGTVRNPRILRPSVEPRFIASILLDVSGSMKEHNKLHNARKLLVFFCELFERIGKEFGYIRSSISIFSDSLSEIKTYEQEYDSHARYAFSDGTHETVKHRLMTRLQATGGTNMLEAIRTAARNLTEESRQYPDHVSVMYFLGDGGDTCGNATKVREFMDSNDQEHGFGRHLHSAILLGTEEERQALADIFGEDHTTVAPDFDELVQQTMTQCARDIKGYVDRLQRRK